MPEIEYMRCEYMAGFLTEAENKILKEIAVSGSQTRYQLFKIAAASTVHNALKKLQKLKLIEVKKEEEFERTGKMKRYYGLTLLGLIAVLKVAGVRLKRVKSKEELVSSWVERVKKNDSESKISQMLGATEAEMDASYRNVMKEIIHLIRNRTEATERFLRHYDVENCDDGLIFQEWIWQVRLAETSSSLARKMSLRQKMLR